jgi:hypothetical protein
MSEQGAVRKFLEDKRIEARSYVALDPIKVVLASTLRDFADAHDAADARLAEENAAYAAGVAEALTTITQLGEMVARREALLRQAAEALEHARGLVYAVANMEDDEAPKVRRVANIIQPSIKSAVEELRAALAAAQEPAGAAKEES